MLMSATPTVLDLRFDWPELRQPIFFIVDDPAPCLNLAFYEQYFEEHVRDVPNRFTAAWADLIEEFGVRGKFSVLPVPAGIGRVDRPLPDVAPGDQEEFLRIMRERVSPRMDIGIEFLTHWHAWDLRRERPVDYTEKTMGPHTNRAHLTEYFSYGLRILADLGLDPTGVTSPGASCREIEWIYQAAVRDAVREVRGLPIAWYFLHVDDYSPVVLPRVKSLDAERGEACVTMVSMAGDPMWRTQFGEPSPMDEWISADGSRGRLVELFRNGSVIGFHTHWQSLFSNGRATGLADFRVALSRIREHFGERVRWTKCSELARVVAAQAVTRPTVTADLHSVTVALSSTIACPDFTCRLALAHEPRAVRVAIEAAGEGVPLRRLPGDEAILRPASWRWRAGELAWCADQPAGTMRVSIEVA
jgi:hypothetical protein